MTAQIGYLDRIRQLEPLSRLPHDSLDALLARAGTVVEFAPGDHVHLQGQHDDAVSYLLAGRVQRSMDGQVLDYLDADREPRRRPLEYRAHRRDTVRALSPVAVLLVQRPALERACRDAAADPGGGVLEVLDIAVDTSTDWQTRLLRSHVFLRLSAEVIAQVFERMQDQEVAAGEDVIRQGEPGAYYYVVHSGLAEVVRRPSADGREVRLAELAPGDAFGEEALIADAPRNATVRMLRAGSVMRLAKPDFLELIVTPLVRGVSVRQGRWLVEQGGAWVDVRDGRAGNGHVVDGALHLPLHLLRLQARRLDPEKSYVVVGDELNTCLLAAFLLAERGFEAAYLERPVSGATLEINQMSETDKGNGSETAAPAGDERLPRDQFAETTTGEELADLIDELTRERDALADQNARLGESIADAPALHDLEARTEAVPRAAGAAPADAEPQAIIDAVLRDMSQGLERTLAESLAGQRGALAERLAQRLEHATRERVAARERQLEARHAESLRQKERELAAAYDRLTSLANRISHQKADIQKARKALEEMLRTASRVHKEVYRVGNALVEQIGHLDEIPDPAAGKPTAH